MRKNQPILVATDLSARSDRAIDRASVLAKGWDVPLIVCHVVEQGSRLAGKPELAMDAVRSALPNPTAQVEIQIAEGSVPATIIRQAIEHDCRLIATGVARFSQLEDYFIGTAVDRIIREADQPVLVVKRRPHADYRSILATTDFSTCSRYALLTAAKMFPDAQIHLVHAFHVPFEGFLSVKDNLETFQAEVQGEFDAFLRDPAIPSNIWQRLTIHLGYGETATVVLQVTDQVAADLVVMGTHGRSGFSKAVFGSMAESLLRCVQVDTLVVREPA